MFECDHLSGLVETAPEPGGAQVHVDVTDGCATASSAPATLSVFANGASCSGGIDGFPAPNA